VENITLYPGISTLRLPNDTLHYGIMIFMRDDGLSSQPRGLLFSADDEDFWEDCPSCFTKVLSKEHEEY